MPSYKSYCWSIGTTSFRMVEFNRKIEQQLKLLDEFWALQPEGLPWSGSNAVQTAYYEFIRERGFIENKDANRKDKDARQKTSGLVDLGLIDNERRLTLVGQALFNIAESGEFDRNNILQIPADSFIYLKQLLKFSYPFEGGYVRPFLILAYIIASIGEITKDEFTYLLPLTINIEKTQRIIDSIQQIRFGETTVDEVILSVLLEMDNYQEAQELFLSNNVTEELIMDIGINRKSHGYDRPYYDLYKALFEYTQTKNDANAIAILDAVKNITGKPKTLWKQYLFNTSLTTQIQKDGMTALYTIPLFERMDERDFKTEFFGLLHLFKAKSLLSDYYDLNKRYFKTSDTILFQDNKVKFDIIPNCYFTLIKDHLLDIAFCEETNISTDCTLADINPHFNVTQDQIFSKAEELYGVEIRNLFDIQTYVDRERYERFNRMIDERFTDNVLVDLMTKFETRDDNNIHAIVTNNADIPTIFEYVLAIAWYKISGKQGKILEYMNLSLDADLLPITHAAGGHEDITYKYEATNDYPAHTLLIEATLLNGTNQRRGESEPVTRHLGDYLLAHSEEAYCLFATTFLHINVVSDFRSRKTAYYFSPVDESRFVQGMKIIPCNTAELKTIIQRGITYAQLYSIFENAYQSNVAPNAWYQQEIVANLD